MGLRLDGIVTSNMDKEFYEWFGFEAVAPMDIEKWLGSGDPDMTLYINSFGGDTMAASQMYTSLARHGGVTAVIDGYACSAASYIPLGCKKISISPTGQIMIHNVSTTTSGDYRDMAGASEELIVANASLKNAYRLKTGLTDEVLQKYMDAETWFDAMEAKRLGFVDEILFTAEDETVPGAVLAAVRQNGRVMYNCMRLPKYSLKSARDTFDALRKKTDTDAERLRAELELLLLR